MMVYYQELTLLTSEEIPINFLWSKVFQQIHLGLVEMQDDQGKVPVGLSFPEYLNGEKRSELGIKLRLFANDEAILKQFDVVKWLARLSDYVHCTSIRPVPEKIIGYVIYQREQPKTNPERLARRYAKRHGVDYDTALNGLVDLKTTEKPVNADYKMQFRYSEMTKKSISSPFIRLKSMSSEQMFCLWVKKISVDSQSSATYFSSYGLSSISTVPEF